MKIIMLALLAALLFSSCSYFSRKMNEQMQEGNKLLEHQVDSMKQALSDLRQKDEVDSVFVIKMDTLYTHGFRLAELADSVWKNDAYDTIYGAELKNFRNYVNRNFDYSDEISTLMPTLDMARKMKGQEMPLGLTGATDMMHTMAKSSIMQIMVACRKQYKPKPAS